MEKDFPFPNLRTRFKPVVPDPVVEYLDTDDTTGNEVVKKLPASLFYEQFPLAKDEVKLQEYLDAGIPLREVPVRLYDSMDASDCPYTQEDLYNKIESIIEEHRKDQNTTEE